MGNRIIIVGGGACGTKTAARAQRCDPSAQITMLDEGALISQATCGLPYYVSGFIKNRGNLLLRTPESFERIYGVDVLTRTRVDSIDRSAKSVRTRNMDTGETSQLEYDKLVLATGSTAIVPKIKGIELAGIHTIKNVPDTDAIIKTLSSGVRKATIVGAGLIGLEMTEVLASLKLEVTIVEALDSVLPGVLDPDIALLLARRITSKGIRLLTGTRVMSFEGESGRVRRAVTASGTIDSDLVIIAAGVSPNTSLARGTGLTLGTTGAIAVNEYLQTSDPDIYAGGDCVECTHLVSRAKVYAPMGSTANKHGRVIGANVTGGRETFPGVTGTMIAKIFDWTIGSTGLGDKQSHKAGFETVTGLAPAPEHATYFPGAHDIIVKLVADKNTRRILGGQILGRGVVDKRIDVLATAVSLGGTIDNLANMDLAYAPPYNSAFDPLHHAANLLRNKLQGLAKTITAQELKDRLDRNADFVLLDVRNEAEWKTWRIEHPAVVFMPQGDVREKLDKLSRDREIVVFCRRSPRAYQVQRTLEGAGFRDVKFLEGSLTAWPYDVYIADKDAALG